MCFKQWLEEVPKLIVKSVTMLPPPPPPLKPTQLQNAYQTASAAAKLLQDNQAKNAIEALAVIKAAEQQAREQPTPAPKAASSSSDSSQSSEDTLQGEHSKSTPAKQDHSQSRLQEKITEETTFHSAEGQPITKVTETL